MRRSECILGIFITLGCSGRAIDVGPNGSGGNANAGGSSTVGAAGNAGSTGLPPSDCTVTTPLPAWPTATSCVANSDLPLVGTWQGYVEGAGMPWDQITLVINGASVSGGLCGTLSIGAGPAPVLPPATDPSVGYPLGNQPVIAGSPSFIPAFVNTLLDGTTDGMRVRFSVTPSEPYRDWCALQTPFAFTDTCSCLPNWAVEQDASTGLCKYKEPTSPAREFEVDCGKFSLCSGVAPICACNASGCDAATALPSTVAFDLRFTGDTAEGSNTHSLGRTYFTRVN